LQNVLVDENWNAKIADFGLSELKDGNNDRGRVGTPLYMAPEMLLEKELSQKTDVYSFGIMLWVRASQKRQPFCFFYLFISSVFLLYILLLLSFSLLAIIVGIVQRRISLQGARPRVDG
jgi:serine/threonine protein kinase